MGLAVLVVAAVFGFLSVAFGAFGAHALKSRLSEYELGIWQTAVQYQMFHSVLLVAVGLWMLKNESIWLSYGSSAWIIGILLFSGSLYVLAFTGLKWLGAITPIGGLFFLLGWIALFVYGVKQA